MFRIIKQKNVYKIQQLKQFLWFKPYWKTLQYDDVGWYGEGGLEDWTFSTIEQARQFIKDTYYPIPYEVVEEM